MMTVTNCKNSREEIDVADLNEQLSSATIEHLQGCPNCRAFHDERGGLRNLMSNLGTVSAPADFDFRLRARLAREKDSPSGVFASGKFLLGARSLAAVALVLLVAGAGIIIRTRMSSRKVPESGLASNSTSRVVTPRDDTKAVTPVAASTPTQPVVSTGTPRDRGTIARGTEPKQRRSPRVPENDRQQMANAPPPNKSAVREASGLGPTVVTLLQPPDAGSVVLVPIDGQALRVSIDDGHGSSHTISVPAVSFGSQRVGERGFSFAPVKSTKGVW